MHQVLQYLNDGKTVAEDVPVPLVRPGHLLIRTAASVISPGTERMLLDFGKASCIEKARQRPDKGRMVVDRILSDSLLSTITAIQAKLEQPIAFGYRSVGTAIGVARSMDGFAVGDRVAFNGQHAKAVCVPANLSALASDGVDNEGACFAVRCPRRESHYRQPCR